ncbi:MAG: YadA-like family protein [Sphingomonas sp.]
MLLASAGYASQAQAQAVTPNLVGACSGVSLPPSVVTGILGPVVGGIVAPIQNTVNPILGILPIVPDLTIDVAGLLADAAAGNPITLQVLNQAGTVVGPADRCDVVADSFGLNTQGGVSIGGNRITGLGTNGLDAAAGEASSIAFGDSALTDATAAGAIAFGTGAGVGAGATGGAALGTGAQVTGANGVALGAGSIAGRGPLAGYAALGLAAPQASAGEVSVGVAGAERQITNVAAGSAPTDAVNVGQLAGVAAQVSAIDTSAVRYDAADQTIVTLAGAGGTTVRNVRAGVVDAASTDAVNGAQLFATNTAVTNNTTAITNLTTNVANGGTGPVQYSNAATPTTPNGGVPTNDLTLVGAAAGPVALHNVAGGAIAAGSTDAVNGGQVFGLAGQLADVITNVSALDASAVRYDAADRTTATLAGAGGTTVRNVRAGVVDAASTDAVNGAQLFATNTAVANNTTAITNLTNGAAGTVQYSNAATPTTPNGGVPTNDLTLVGAAAGPVALHNVAGGAIAAGSTDAVNGGQIFGLALTAVNAVSYDADAGGARTNTVTLAGGNAAAPVTIRNVAPGTVAAGSTEAVNGGQLQATNQAVATAQTTAGAALVLGQNSVQYDNTTRRDITLGAGGAGPVALHNVAPGTSATDAVNVAQLATGLGGAVSQSNAYTDQRLAAVNFDLRRVRRDSYAGTAGALAAAGLPQAYEAGAGMIAMAGGTYRGQSAFALGLSKAMSDGRTVVKLSGTYDTQNRVGGAAGVGYQF